MIEIVITIIIIVTAIVLFLLSYNITSIIIIHSLIIISLVLLSLISSPLFLSQLSLALWWSSSLSPSLLFSLLPPLVVVISAAVLKLNGGIALSGGHLGNKSVPCLPAAGETFTDAATLHAIKQIVIKSTKTPRAVIRLCYWSIITRVICASVAEAALASLPPSRHWYFEFPRLFSVAHSIYNLPPWPNRHHICIPFPSASRRRSGRSRRSGTRRRRREGARLQSPWFV